MRIHLTTHPPVSHDKAVCYAGRHHHIYKLGSMHTSYNGKVTKTFRHHHLKPGKTYVVACKLSAKKHYMESYTKPRYIKIHR